MTRQRPSGCSGSLLAIAALALAGTAYAAGPDSTAKPSGWHANDRTIRLVEASAVAQPTFVDVGKPGPSIGDIVVVTDGLAYPNGAEAGVMRQDCTPRRGGLQPADEHVRVRVVVRAERRHDRRGGALRPRRAGADAAVTGGTARLSRRTGRGHRPRRGRPDHDQARRLVRSGRPGPPREVPAAALMAMGCQTGGRLGDSAHAAPAHRRPRQR